jgi:hypothetical protein
MYKKSLLFIGTATLYIGLVVLMGWFLNIPYLKTGFWGETVMKANAALVFTLSGSALLLFQTKWRFNDFLIILFLYV